LELQIEKLVYGGDGLARLAADERGRGKTVFLPYVIPGERVEATLTQSRSGFARARLNKVLKASAQRVEPQCPYFGRCGGCQYQHIDYSAQLQYKVEILRETFRRTAKLELAQEIQVHASEPWHYRNRTRVHVRHEPGFALGYFQANSHKLLAVETCPVSSTLINRAMALMWELGQRSMVPAQVHGMQFFANHHDSALLAEIYRQPQSEKVLAAKFGEAFRSRLPEVAGVAVFATPQAEDETRQLAPLTSVHNERADIVGEGHINYRAAGFAYRVSAGAFFQTNRYLVDELVAVTTEGASGRVALELYAGVGLFTKALAASFKDVVAVEGSPHAVADLRVNVPANVKPVEAAAEAFLETQAGQVKPDFILLDPPRAGIGEKAAEALGRSSAGQVTLVSCDPATLSRDLRILLESGFRVAEAHLFDLFPQTAHVETVLRLTR
jgi:23S rRNA (uracil1939-C5)-methyltransferase